MAVLTGMDGLDLLLSLFAQVKMPKFTRFTPCGPARRGSVGLAPTEKPALEVRRWNLPKRTWMYQWASHKVTRIHKRGTVAKVTRI